MKNNSWLYEQPVFELRPYHYPTPGYELDLMWLALLDANKVYSPVTYLQ